MSSSKSAFDGRRIGSALSPELSERLRPSVKDRQHLSSRDHHDFHRNRRHHRRANKRGRRQKIRERSPPNTASGQVSPLKSSHHHHVHRRPPALSKHLVLRPTKGPLLNAPRNSTQFIIDDHETSPFLDTDADDSPAASSIPAATAAASKKYNTRSRQSSLSSSRRVSQDHESPQRSPNKIQSQVSLEKASKEAASEKDCQATPGNYVVNDDDYTSWAEFSERDFQTVYESAHHEQVADWDRHRLIEEITNLENRQKELVNILAKVDPEVYAQRLEAQLQALQEKNRLLRSNVSSIDEFEEGSKSPLITSPDSSTKE